MTHDYSDADQARDLDYVNELKEEVNALYLKLFHLNVGGRFHAFLEWCGVMHEHLNICEDMIRRGVPAFEMNRHTGATPDIPGYRLTYMAEKLECIFDGLLDIQTHGSSEEAPKEDKTKDAYRAVEHLTDIPRHHQTQRALDDQLRDLSVVASRLGLYDAADFLRDKVERKKK